MSVWVGDHMLFHANPKTRFPVARGRIPDHYAHSLNRSSCFPMAAATPKKLRIGNLGIAGAEHPPSQPPSGSQRSIVSQGGE